MMMTMQGVAILPATSWTPICADSALRCSIAGPAFPVSLTA